MAGWATELDPNSPDYKYGRNIWRGQDEYAGMEVDVDKARDGQMLSGQEAVNAAQRGEVANRNNYFYGGLGKRDKAEEDVNTFRSWMPGNTLDYNNNAALAARGNQTEALQYMGQAAAGNVPSHAETLHRRAMGAAASDQYAMAASARGGAGAQAAAMRNANNQSAQLQAQAATQGQALRAQEMADARQAYFMGSTNLRNQDIQNESQRAGLVVQNAQVNDQRRLGLINAEQNVRRMQLDASMGYDTNAAAARQRMQQRADDEVARKRAEAQKWADRGMAVTGKFATMGWG